jgi:hypothetical protein
MKKNNNNINNNYQTKEVSPARRTPSYGLYNTSCSLRQSLDGKAPYPGA